MKALLPKLILALFCITLACDSAAGNDLPNDVGNGDLPIIINGSSQQPTVVQLIGYYNLNTHDLTFCFPSVESCNYTIEISSMYASLEYYFSTPTAKINLSAITDAVIDISITTDDDYYYWATVDTSDPDCPSE